MRWDCGNGGGRGRGTRLNRKEKRWNLVEKIKTNMIDTNPDFFFFSASLRFNHKDLDWIYSMPRRFKPNDDPASHCTEMPPASLDCFTAFWRT